MPQPGHLAKWTKAIVFVALILAIFLMLPERRQARIDRSVALDKISIVSKGLMDTLTKEIETNGPAGAIEFCRSATPRIMEFASTGDYSIRRIGTRVRNHATNEPTEREREILAQFANLAEDQRSTAIHEEAQGEGWALYKPIWIGSPICLQCHGPEEQIPDDVRAALTRLYPDDDATGYSLGELRGAFVVEAKP